MGGQKKEMLDSIYLKNFSDLDMFLKVRRKLNQKRVTKSQDTRVILDRSSQATEQQPEFTPDINILEGSHPSEPHLLPEPALKDQE